MPHPSVEEKKTMYRLGVNTGKPDWSEHEWPQLVQSPDGHWFGVMAGWKMIIHQDFKEGDVFSLLSSDCEWLAYGPVIDWRNSLEQRPSNA